MKGFRILFILLCAGLTHAQSLQLILNPPPGATLAPTDCWNVTITNAGQEERVYLMGIVQDATGKRLSEVRSAPLKLRAGINQLDRQLVQTTRTDYKDPEAQRAVLGNGYFPKGAYKICVAVIRNHDDRDLGQACLDYTVTSDAARDKGKMRNKHVQFYGNAAVEGVYANQQGFRQDLPPSYGRVDFNPAAAVFGAPINAEVHLTTEQSDSFPDLNTYALRFDRNTFQRNLQDILLRKLEESFQKRAKADAKTLAQLQELDRLDAILKDPSLVRELSGIDSLKAQIGNIESDASLEIAEKTAKIALVRQRYDLLLAKKGQIDRLTEQKNRLTNLKSELERSGQLAEMKNRVQEVPNLSDPSALRRQMRQFGLLEGMNRWLFGIDELAIGTSFPVYSPLTMQGLQVTGGHLAWNPGPVYLAVTKGKAQTAYLNTFMPLDSRFEQDVIGGRIGVGKIYRNHLAATALRFTDDARTLQLPANTERFATQTTVASTDFELSLGRKRQFEWIGEVAGLLFNRNKKDASRLNLKEISNHLPTWLEPNLSTSADFAWNSRIHLNLFNQHTRITAATRFVGPGFIQPGTPGLRNDILMYEGRLEQHLFRNQLQLGGAYQIESDNFSGGKGYLTLRNQISGEIGLRIKHLPNLNVQYMHSLQQNDLLDYAADVLSASLAQPWRIGKKTRANTHLQFLRFSNAIDSLTAAQYTANYYYLNQLFSFRRGIAVNAGAQLTQTSTASGTTLQQIFQAMLSSRFLKKGTFGAGITLANSKEIDQKLGGQLQFQLALNQFLSFDMICNWNKYSQIPGSSNQSVLEQFARARLAVRW